MGKKISHLQLQISTLLLNEKSQHFKFKKANTHPRRRSCPSPCLAFADIWGSDVDVGMGNHQVECFHLSADELSHVLRSALALAHPEIGIFALLLLDESEFPTTKNLRHTTTTTTTGFPTPIYWIIPKYRCFWEGNLLVPFKKKALRIMGFSGAQFYIYIHILYILPFKTNYKRN